MLNHEQRDLKIPTGLTDKQLKDYWAYQVDLVKGRSTNHYVLMLIPNARILKELAEKEMDLRGIPWNIKIPTWNKGLSFPTPEIEVL